MDEANGGLWRTLARIYSSVLACGLCVPALAAVPVVFGIDSLLVTLCSGSVGLAVAGGVVVVVDARLDAAAARSGSDLTADPDASAQSRGSAAADDGQ
jgi:hypothetical protein